MDAKERIKNQIDAMFARAPISRAAIDLKEELLANATARYDDLTAAGMGEDEAIRNVVGSIGNVSELIAALPPEELPNDPAADAAWRQRSAVLVTLGVGLYMVGILLFLGGPLLGVGFAGSRYSTLAAIVLAIVATCVLVFNAASRPRYYKSNDTVVENFKEWNENGQRQKGVRGSISSIIWTVCLVAYFLVSFGTGAWYITWVIFLVAACAETVVSLLFNLKKVNK